MNLTGIAKKAAAAFVALTLSLGIGNTGASASDMTVTFGDMQNVAAGVSAVQLDSTIGLHFKTNAEMTQIGVSCPSFSNNIGALTLSIHKWQGDADSSEKSKALQSKRYEDFIDNTTLSFVFDSALEPGDYYLCLSEPRETVGVWYYTDSDRCMMYIDGIEAQGCFSGSITFSDSSVSKDSLLGVCESIYDTSVRVTTPPEYTVPEDDILNTRDSMSDTWAATDGLGRTLPDNSVTGDADKEKFVGLFYTDWHGYHSKRSPGVINIQKLIEQYPEAKNDFRNEIWADKLNYANFWNEPIYGYYGADKWVLRNQAELLADAGVDVIIFDNTNGTMIWRDYYNEIFETFAEARRDGVNTPKIAFLLPFSDTDNTNAQVEMLYKDIYRLDKYRELWFYWKGKPLIMADDSVLDKSNPFLNEAADFFTFRHGQPAYSISEPVTDGRWGWLSVYPQNTYLNPDGTVEEMTVGISQNWASGRGLTAMNGIGVFGRSHTSTSKVEPSEISKLYGANFSEQFEYALKKDPEFIFVTGWNEWIAGRYETWGGVKNAFPDEFNDEYSRDIEPTKGDLKDHYYYLMTSYIRKYKGTRTMEKSSPPVSIDITSGASQWDNIAPHYISYAGNTFDRDAVGYAGIKYTDTSGRNDLTDARVAQDAENLYFMVQCAESITPYTDTAWMRLFISNPQSADKGWESFQYVVNRVSPTADKAVLEVSKGGWSWERVCDVDYSLSSDTLQIKIPKSALNISAARFTLNFKWTDNTVSDGDIMDIYTSGDAAPGGRFAYVYKSNPLPDGAVYGDTNGDKAVTAADALLCLQHAVGKIKLTDDALAVADVNGDGAVTAADALMVLQCAVGKTVLE